MKAIALANRLVRDLDAKSVVDLTADARLEILDAINGALQTLHSLAPPDSKITVVSLSVAAPRTVSVGVVNGSPEVTIATFDAEDRWRTIRIAGDDIDNQVIGATSLLHPYGGATGTVSATIYGDAVELPEPYIELVGDPTVLETRDDLISFRPLVFRNMDRRIGHPRFYWVESNARNQNPTAPAVIRFDPMPDKLYRMQCRASLAPAKVTFADLISPGPTVPLRAEHIESYLIPLCRSTLTHSKSWMNKDDIAATRAEAKDAKSEYEALTAQTIATPNNRVRTRPGY